MITWLRNVRTPTDPGYKEATQSLAALHTDPTMSDEQRERALFSLLAIAKLDKAPVEDRQAALGLLRALFRVSSDPGAVATRVWLRDPQKQQSDEKNIYSASPFFSSSVLATSASSLDKKTSSSYSVKSKKARTTEVERPNAAALSWTKLPSVIVECARQLMGMCLDVNVPPKVASAARDAWSAMVLWTQRGPMDLLMGVLSHAAKFSDAAARLCTSFLESLLSARVAVLDTGSPAVGQLLALFRATPPLLSLSAEYTVPLLEQLVAVFATEPSLALAQPKMVRDLLVVLGQAQYAIQNPAWFFQQIEELAMCLREEHWSEINQTRAASVFSSSSSTNNNNNNNNNNTAATASFLMALVKWVNSQGKSITDTTRGHLWSLADKHARVWPTAFCLADTPLENALTDLYSSLAALGSIPDPPAQWGPVRAWRAYVSNDTVRRTTAGDACTHKQPEVALAFVSALETMGHSALEWAVITDAITNMPSQSLERETCLSLLFRDLLQSLAPPPKELSQERAACVVQALTAAIKRWFRYPAIICNAWSVPSTLPIGRAHQLLETVREIPPTVGIRWLAFARVTARPLDEKSWEGLAREWHANAKATWQDEWTWALPGAARIRASPVMKALWQKMVVSTAPPITPRGVGEVDLWKKMVLPPLPIADPTGK